MHKRHFSTRYLIFIVLGLFAVGLLIGYLVSGNGEPIQDSITVERGVISQEVIITGKVRPAEDANLAFQTSGRVNALPVSVGDHVVAGQMLARLDASELYPQLEEAQGSLAAQQAKLDEVKLGARTEDIDVKRSEFQKAEQDFVNYYAGAPDVLQDAYAKADDAVTLYIDALFTNDDSSTPQLSFITGNSQAEIDAESLRSQSGTMLSAWRTELGPLTPNSPRESIDANLALGIQHLSLVRELLARLLDALNSSGGLSTATIEAYKTDVGTARTNVNTAMSNVNTRIQTLAAQKVTVSKLDNELTLKLAGPTLEALRAQEAQVNQAEARVRLIEAQLANTYLRAPFTGVVTKKNFSVGEVVTAQSSVISMISEGTLEIETNVPETDFVSISPGNPVRITFDALPSETFDGLVSFVDPAETIIDGVVNFAVTISFASADPRIKSGLTANLTIETLTQADILFVPQAALLEDDRGVFVQKVVDGEVVETSVTVGIRSQTGMVQLLSGVSEGDTVLNVGARPTTN
ncbi:MAG: hypothetical protein A3I31_02245 [Candidatus Colwellbacteria bacterium RIFCSPLOWO2_02_FULL_44_20b]|uniref:Membrane fusion protein biotin-lipoyl like domain-containing protein n=1 Tax=Candidatus Colwellbacteria bacterium RIFCSPLOWO2_02_FULL_44_20b TaxID=1797691 RepID=A0A1G1Z457_9BACT|nr:MAG: hypothetical protein A3I31_02245 [Candidatus Colwellbacteria bacterium RIFCSPLOWO2_02_FULL_44_20b]